MQPCGFKYPVTFSHFGESTAKMLLAMFGTIIHFLVMLITNVTNVFVLYAAKGVADVPPNTQGAQ